MIPLTPSFLEGFFLGAIAIIFGAVVCNILVIVVKKE